MINPRADKNLGQHFLCDAHALRKIADAAHISPGDRILEIGPGTGYLTREILRHGPSKLHAIEKDDRFIPHLQDLEQRHGGRFRYCISDATKFDFGEFRGYKLISNLPYNIAGYLLQTWIQNPNTFSSYTVTLQKEVVDRIVSAPHGKIYGKLSVLMQVQFHIEVVCSIKNTAFVPAPKVHSSVITLTPSSRFLGTQNLERLCDFLNLVFSHRRKKIYNALRMRHGKDELSALEQWDLQRRPETFSPEQFMAMSSMLP